MMMGATSKQMTLDNKIFYDSICPVCGKRFNKKYHTEKYCSDGCREQAVREQKLKYNHEKRTVGTVKVTCQYCGKEFIREHNSQVYCSDKCRHYAYLERFTKYSRKRRKSIRNKELVTNERNVVGTNYLSGKRREDFDEEQKAILKEMKRLKLR